MLTMLADGKVAMQARAEIAECCGMVARGRILPPQGSAKTDGLFDISVVGECRARDCAAGTD